MKRSVSVLFLFLCVCNAWGAQSGRPAMSNKIMSAPRYTASVNQLNAMSSATNGTNVNTNNTVTTTTETTPEQEEKDMREAERNACINNNIGVGNTFVWASRYSDTSNYANMIEDVNNPENNVCFVRVELKSSDESRISVSDIAPKYFMWGEIIECGGWVNKNDMEERILDARKGARIGGIVASTVGGAGLGVGVMELFGNKLIGGKVEGQKALSDVELYRSQLLVMQKENPAQFQAYAKNLKTIREAYNVDHNNVPNYSVYEPLIIEFAEK